jgi:hypothetical protein
LALSKDEKSEKVGNAHKFTEDKAKILPYRI